MLTLLYTVKLGAALPPAARFGEALSKEQPTPPVLEQVRLTAPLKPFVELRLITSIALADDASGMMVVSGTMVKSESGLEMAAPLFSVVAEML